MVLIQDWLPPSRENWELVSWAWQFFPIITAIQWLTDFYPQGKTSIPSRFNLPGRHAWTLMELPGVLIVLYCMATLPSTTNPLPWPNKAMAAMYTAHYAYRAVLAPQLLNPSMAPIHPLVFFSAAAWQVANGLALGGWLAAYGPVRSVEWAPRLEFVLVGAAVWAWGLAANVWHDGELREIRRAAARRAGKEKEKEREREGEGAKGKEQRVERVYMVPQNGLFRHVLYAHYFCEWVEWAGFWMVGGWGCVPARSFLLNEISAMLPRALAGRRWYVARFGAERIAGRKAVVPGLI